MSVNNIAYYKEHQAKYTAEAQKLHKQMISLSMLRLLVFVATGFGIYVTFQTWQIALGIAVVGIAVFLFLLSKYNTIKSVRLFNKALVSINEEEIEIASGNFHDREEGLRFQDPNHFYSLDIDLFGRGSFFQFINRTTINEGQEKLADLLKANNTEGIVSRQKAIEELSKKPEWRQHYAANSSLIETETSAKHIVTWLKNYKSFLPKLMKWLPLLFTVISVVLFGLTILELISQDIVGYWLLVGLGFTGFYVKKINQLSSGADKVKDTFRQYAVLLNLIENETFTSELLQKKQQQIQSEHKKASLIFKELSKGLDALDNRNNIISAIFSNGLFLSDIKNSYRIEKWINQYGDKVEDWFEVIGLKWCLFLMLIVL